MREWLIRLLGGYIEPLAIDAAIERIAEMDDLVRKREILTLATKRLFNTVSADDILSQRADGSWMFQGKPITLLEVESMQKEAQAIQNTRFWTVLDNEIKYHCNKRMRAATTLMELEGAKCIEFAWDIIKTRLARMQSTALPKGS